MRPPLVLEHNGNIRESTADVNSAFSIIPYRHLEAVLDLYDEVLSRSLQLKDGAKETLLAARANGLRIMVVSEDPQDAQEATLERLEIAPLADLLVTSAAEKASKRGGLLKIALAGRDAHHMS